MPFFPNEKSFAMELTPVTLLGMEQILKKNINPKLG
jgi:hypothetical protein